MTKQRMVELVRDLQQTGVMSEELGVAVYNISEGLCKRYRLDDLVGEVASETTLRLLKCHANIRHDRNVFGYVSRVAFMFMLSMVKADQLYRSRYSNLGHMKPDKIKADRLRDKYQHE